MGLQESNDSTGLPDGVPSEGAISTPNPQEKRRAWVLIAVLALLAGLGAWLWGEFTRDHFEPDAAAAAARFAFAAHNKQMARVTTLNGQLAFCGLGALLGLALGLAGGLARRSWRRAIDGASVGLILGLVAGMLPAMVLMPYWWNHRNDDPSTSELIMPIMIHLGLWSACGLAAGLAFAVGRYGFQTRRMLEFAMVGLAGAMIGTFFFDLIGALCFPLAETAHPISGTALTRLFARASVAGFVAMSIIWSLPESELATKG